MGFPERLVVLFLLSYGILLGELANDPVFVWWMEHHSLLLLACVPLGSVVPTVFMYLLLVDAFLGKMPVRDICPLEAIMLSRPLGGLGCWCVWRWALYQLWFGGVVQVICALCCCPELAEGFQVMILLAWPTLSAQSFLSLLLAVLKWQTCLEAFHTELVLCTVREIMYYSLYLLIIVYIK